MTAGVMRLGVVGTGRVFERLYRPALERVNTISLAAACDVRATGDGLPPGVSFHGSLDKMLAAGGLDAVAVLTPPRLHAEQARAVLAAGLRVLVEKPVAMDLAELRGVLEAGHDLTPAFPRRYWPSYRCAGAGVTRLELETSPEAWGAHDDRGEDAAFDLLPHLADLACTAKGGAPVAVSGTRTASVAEGLLRFEDGTSVRCRAAHGTEYREWFAAGGTPQRVGPPGFAQALMGRVRREPPVDVSGMAALLEAWAANEAGAPGVEDAWNSVAVVEAYWRSVASGREEPVERWAARP